MDVLPSRSTAGLIIVPMLLVIVAVVFYTPFAWYWLAAICLLPTAIMLYYLCLHYWQIMPHSVREIAQNERGEWLILTRSGDWQAAELASSSFAHLLLQVLVFKTPQQQLVAILPADSQDADVPRRLRVKVRLRESLSPRSDQYDV